MAKTDFSSSSPLAGSFFAGRITYPPRQTDVGRLAHVDLWRRFCTFLTFCSHGIAFCVGVSSHSLACTSDCRLCHACIICIYAGYRV